MAKLALCHRDHRAKVVVDWPGKKQVDAAVPCLLYLIMFSQGCKHVLATKKGIFSVQVVHPFQQWHA